MKKHYLLLMLIPVLILSGCGKKHSKDPVQIPVSPEITDQIPVATAKPEPVIYNSIDQLSSSERSALKKEILEVANACKDIYKNADKGSTYNATLSDNDIAAMVYKIAELGYPAIDYDGKLDMQCAQPLIDMGYSIFSNENLVGTYYEVYRDGQITAYRMCRNFNEWHLITMSVEWDKKGKPEIYTEGQYDIGDVQFTAKGWLIYNRDYSSFDDNQKSNLGSYVFVKLKPVDPTMRSLCQRYIEPIGYLENNLFTTTWNESYYNPIDFNSLYASLFSRYNGSDYLTSYNAMSYYRRIDRTNLFLIPTNDFETVVQNYFDIGSDTLKNISDYSSRLGGYLFLGYDKDYYNVLPRTPEPEVVDYWYNSDGTLTMRVDAINRWYGTDKAFSHDVTVRDEGNGQFKYVANTYFNNENDILPEYKLNYLLDAERAKIK